MSTRLGDVLSLLLVGLDFGDVSLSSTLLVGSGRHPVAGLAWGGLGEHLIDLLEGQSLGLGHEEVGCRDRRGQRQLGKLMHRATHPRRKQRYRDLPR